MDAGPLPDELAAAFRARFDAVVMLTWSNWKTEPRSNRYHYASRFGRTLPVLFVQEGTHPTRAVFEATDTPGVTLLHAPPSASVGGCDRLQTTAVARALQERGVTRPLAWVYNCHLHRLLRCLYAPLKVYHATEDYVSGGYYDRGPRFFDDLRRTLDGCDLLVAVSEGVERAYREKAGFPGPTLVATNGCDFRFFTAGPEPTRTDAAPVVCYQGGVNNRLDLDLILDVVRRLPHWRFRFLGAVHFTRDEASLKRRWVELLAAPNFTHLGRLSPERMRDEMRSATVGLIPFVRCPTLTEHSFPLKAFEYVACGLPVVGVPVKALRAWPELFAFGETGEELAAAIERARGCRHDPDLLQLRAREAALQDYDRKFLGVVERLIEAQPRTKPGVRRVLVLYDDRTLDDEVRTRLGGILKHTGADVRFAPCTGGRKCAYDLTGFDAVVIDDSVAELSPSFAAALRGYPGVKLGRAIQAVAVDRLEAQLDRLLGPAADRRLEVFSDPLDDATLKRLLPEIAPRPAVLPAAVRRVTRAGKAVLRPARDVLRSLYGTAKGIVRRAG